MLCHSYSSWSLVTNTLVTILYPFDRLTLSCLRSTLSYLFGAILATPSLLAVCALSWPLAPS